MTLQTIKILDDSRVSEIMIFADELASFILLYAGSHKYIRSIHDVSLITSTGKIISSCL